ncbi:MAG: glycosyltransferase family 2 protein [Actinomycetes bacterium]
MASSAQQSDGLHITAIVVVHDGEIWLPQVVASLTSQTRVVDHTIAVDTASVDSSSKLLKNSRVPCISRPRDTGFGAAIDSAISHLPPIEGTHEWLWFIHDDCAPQAGALKALIGALENRPQVAIAGPKILGWHDRTHLLERGISIAGNGARWTGLEPHEYDQGQHDGVHEVLAVSTAGMLVRRDVFEELGGFDKHLALFRDDVDFGWRARVAGHSIIAVTDSVIFHAEAAASERRSVDVSDALLKRPLLLDRHNAAYVLLANSSWWLLPWVALQLLGSSLVRAVGYLLAKLPGYAADEVLAVALLIVRPRVVRSARKFRKPHRLISSRVVSAFIPPRWSQLRLGISRLTEDLRERFLPPSPTFQSVLEVANEDEDLLAPVTSHQWRSIFKRAEIIGILFLLIFTTLWSRHRYGSLSGGALSTTPESAMDLWRRYLVSWHAVAMGSAVPTPTWVSIIAMASALTLGKASFFIAALFWATPLILMWSMHSLVRQFTKNSWLIVGASASYALTPVAIASVNSGRLGTIVTLIVAPQIVRYLPRLLAIETLEWQFIFGFSLLLALLSAFSLPAYAGITALFTIKAGGDYLDFRRSQDKELLIRRLSRLIILIVSPIALCLPWSLQEIIHPSGFLLEPGLSIAGGGPNFAISANPGGGGSVPWWLISPITLVLLVAVFSSSKARRYAEAGLVFLMLGTVVSSLSFFGHGGTIDEKLWAGSLIALATIASMCCAVIILDGLGERLAVSRFHYRHVLAGLVVASTLFYTATASVWALTVGSNSLVRANQESILPPFLAISPGVKTLVLRSIHESGLTNLNFFIARESDSILGDPDVSPDTSAILISTVKAMVDGSGLNASSVLSAHGIKYVFMKNPVDPQVVRAIDGVGGFIRNSATKAGIVWRVAGVSERLVFTNASGVSQSLVASDIGARTSVSSKGVISLAENFDASWKVIQDGKMLVRTQSMYGLPQFQSIRAGEFSLFHDGTTRRGWLAIEFIVALFWVVMALPAGRRKREISVEELT